MSLRKLKRKLFTGVLAGMVFTSSAVALAATYSCSKTFYSYKESTPSNLDYCVGAYVQYTTLTGLDRGDYYVNIGGRDRDDTYITYEVYKRWGNSSHWDYKTYVNGKLGVWKGKKKTESLYSDSGYKRFIDAESFRVRINMDHDNSLDCYAAATNEDY